MTQSNLYTQFVKEMEGKDNDAKGLSIGMKNKKGDLLILGGWRSNLWQAQNGLYRLDTATCITPEDAIEFYNRYNQTNLQLDYIEKVFEPWFDRQIKRYQVPSRSGRKRPYTVKKYPDGSLTCTCTGFQFRQKCWHTTAIKELTND